MNLEPMATLSKNNNRVDMGEIHYFHYHQSMPMEHDQRVWGGVAVVLK
jgi:hypothetical protein